MPSPPSLSIIVEWENAGRIGCERARRMIAQLHRQLSNLPAGLVGDIEVLLVYESGHVDGDEIRAAIEAHDRWPAQVRYLPSQVSGYYEQKNYGCEHAAGEIIIFVDSDVVPEPGWLEGLLSPFITHEAKIVAGATSVERDGFYSTAMALGWIFPLPPVDRGVESAPLFYANNVAFRREMIEEMRFPPAEQYRVQVGAVHRSLAQRGHQILMNGAAAVLHPPPRGLDGFVTRALWCGYDASTALPRRAGSILAKAPLMYGTQVFTALRSVARDRRRVGLGPLGTAGALLVIGAYQGIRLFGFIGGLLAPRATWRQLKRIAP
jgi:hypothetical protein